MGRQFFIDTQKIRYHSDGLADLGACLRRLAMRISDVEDSLDQMTEFERVQRFLDEKIEQVMREAYTMFLLSETAWRVAELYDESEEEIFTHAEHSRMRYQRHEAGLSHWKLSGSIAIH